MTPATRPLLTLETIASICHEANRAYCVAHGDDSQPSWGEAPSWQRESARDGVTAILEGRVTTPEASHNNWLAQKQAEGWVYGPVKDPVAKTHPCFLAYDRLPAEQRAKDALFFGIVTALGALPKEG